MKKRISLILALVMLLGAVFSVCAVAEDSASAPIGYKPEVSYTSVAYTKGVVFKFAVPAVTLGEGEKVELIVWSAKELASSFAYDDPYADVIAPDADKATINGVEHFVYTYDELKASMMTDVIYARPVYTSAAGVRTYGDLIDYSVVEYVKTACGEFDGFAGLAEDVQTLLKSLLDFGATAQIFLGGDEPYAPNGFLANDKLNKAWIVPVINGVELSPVFAGFFKYDEGSHITINTPIYDSYSVGDCLDAAGAVVEDADIRTDGIQIPAVDGDITFKCVYDVKSFNNLNPTLQDVADKVYVNNVTQQTHDFLGFKGAANLSTILSGNKFHSLGVVADPSDPTNAVIKWTANNYSALYLSAFKNATTFSGFGDTVYPAITVEFELGRVNGKIISTGGLRLRHDLNGQNNINVFGTKADGTVFITVAEYDADGNPVFRDKGNIVSAGGVCGVQSDIGVVAEEGMTKFAVTFDFRTGMLYGYMEEDGVMKLKTSGYHNFGRGWYNLVTAGETPNYADIETWATSNSLSVQWMGGSNWSTALDSEVVDMGDGIMVPVKEADGTYNTEALIRVSEENCAMLLDNFRICLGSLYQ